MLVFLVVFLKICKGMKTFLNDNIAEALIVSGEVIDERIQALDSSVSKKMSSLQYENQTLRDDLNSRLDGISSIIREANNQTGNNFSYLREELIQKIGTLASVKATKGTDTATIVSALREEMAKLLRAMSQNMEDVSHKIEGLSATLAAIKSEGAGIDSEGIIKSLNLIVTELRDKIAELVGTLAKNIEEVQKGTIKNFEDEIKKFNKAIDTAVTNINKASAKTAQVTGGVQSTLDKGIKDIESNFNQLGVKLQGITQKAEKQINDDYQNNMKAMFDTMAGNLEAITSNLYVVGTEGELSKHIQTLQDTMNDVTEQLKAIATKLDQTYQAFQQQTPQADQLIAVATPKKPRATPKKSKTSKKADKVAAAPTDDNGNDAASTQSQQDDPEKGASS